MFFFKKNSCKHNFSPWKSYIQFYSEFDSNILKISDDWSNVRQARVCISCGLEEHRIVENSINVSYNMIDALNKKVSAYVIEHYTDESRDDDTKSSESKSLDGEQVQDGLQDEKSDNQTKFVLPNATIP